MRKKTKATIAKINQTKYWFFEKISKMDKPLARLIKNRRKRNQIDKTRNEEGEVTTDNTEMKRIIKERYEQQYAHKRDN